MLITIKNPRMTVVIDSTDTRLISLRDASGRGCIRQCDPKYWKKYFPLLFPVVGNCQNDRTILEDRIYAIERHGFCRKRDFDVSQETSSEVVFSVGDTSDTHKAYPYAFRLSLAYELEDGVLFMKYQMEGRDQRDMWYVIGARPGFSCPMEKSYALEDYQLVFEKGENTVSTPYDLNQLHFAPYRIGTTLKSSILPLSREIFRHDAVFLNRLDSRVVSILNPATERGVEVRFPGLETVIF